MTLNPCPCGETPTALIVECEDRAKWGRVAGNCCNDWIVEFRNGYAAEGSAESMERAAEAWNSAPRKAT